MHSWTLHKHWAKKMGINEEISKEVDRAIDEEGGDLRGKKLLEKLNKKGLLNDSVKEETFKAVVLHNVMDCLRDFIWEMGSEPINLIPPEKLLRVAYHMCVDREYVFIGVRPSVRDFENMVESLEIYSKELVDDIISELSKKGLREVGLCYRIKKEKYVRWLMEEIPELEKYRKYWEYSKL